jgi:hypothetical protein
MFRQVARMAVYRKQAYMGKLTVGELVLVVPIRIIALHSVTDNRRGTVQLQRNAAEHGPQRGDVVPIHFRGAKTKRAPFVYERLQILNLARESCRLDLVVIDQGREVGELVLAGAQRGLPDRTFIDLAVAHEHEHAAVAATDALRERHADAIGEAMAERAGRCNATTGAASTTSFMATIGQRIVMAPCCSNMRANTSSSRVSGTTIRRPAKASPIRTPLKEIGGINIIYEHSANMKRRIYVSLLCRSSVRGHRPEIMFGVLVVVFCPDCVSG